MAYCKNCGSILAGNANFCHVCGSKVEFEDSFNKDEPEIIIEEKKEEPMSPPPSYASYGIPNLRFMTPEELEEQRNKAQARKAFIPGLIGMIGTALIGFEAFSNYILTVYQYNSQRKAISDTQYGQAMSQMLFTVGAYLILGVILGIVLGSIGLKLSIKHKNKKGIIFSTIALSLAAICLAFCVVAFIFYAKVKTEFGV